MFSPKKVAHRLHPILGLGTVVISPLKKMAVRMGIARSNCETSPLPIRHTQPVKRDIFHARGLGDPNAVRPDPKLCSLARAAQWKEDKEQAEQQARALRRARARELVPGALTYSSFPELFPQPSVPPSASKPATNHRQTGPSNFRAAGSFKRDKPAASKSMHHRGQKLRDRCMENSRRVDVPKPKDLTRQVSVDLSRLSLSLETLPQQQPTDLDDFEVLLGGIEEAGGSLTKAQELFLKESRRMKREEEHYQLVDEIERTRARVGKTARKNDPPVDQERSSKRVRIQEQPVKPSKAEPTNLGKGEHLKRPNRYGLPVENSSLDLDEVFKRVDGVWQVDEEATRKRREENQRVKEEMKKMQEREAWRAEQERKLCAEVARVAALSDPFQTDTRQPSGRRVAATGGHHTRTRPRAPPVPTPKQLGAEMSVHTEFLQKAQQAEDNDRRMEEAARCVEEFNERIRFQKEQEERAERLRQDRLEARRLRDVFQQQAEERRWACERETAERHMHAGPSVCMSIDQGGPSAAIPTAEGRFREHDKSVVRRARPVFPHSRQHRSARRSHASIRPLKRRRRIEEPTQTISAEVTH